MDDIILRKEQASSKISSLFSQTVLWNDDWTVKKTKVKGFFEIEAMDNDCLSNNVRYVYHLSCEILFIFYFLQNLELNKQCQNKNST